MMKVEVVRPYVEKILAEILGAKEVTKDPDGDIPIRDGSAVFYVRLIDAQPVVVRVFSSILHDVKKTSALFDTLNEVNLALTFARVFWDDKRVHLAMDLVAETLDKEELSNACAVISEAANYFARKIQEKHGGEPAFPFEDAAQVPDPESEPTDV